MSSLFQLAVGCFKLSSSICLSHTEKAISDNHTLCMWISIQLDYTSYIGTCINSIHSNMCDVMILTYPSHILQFFSCSSVINYMYMQLYNNNNAHLTEFMKLQIWSFPLECVTLLCTKSSIYSYVAFVKSTAVPQVHQKALSYQQLCINLCYWWNCSALTLTSQSRRYHLLQDNLVYISTCT